MRLPFVCVTIQQASLRAELIELAVLD